MSADEVVTLNTFASDQEIEAYKQLLELYNRAPIPPQEIMANLGLFLNRASLSRILSMHHLYSQIVHTHGVVMEFGVRWGQNLSLFSSLRNMLEPHNFSRKIVGFDTFEGFPSVTDQDGPCREGMYGVTENYEAFLENLLAAQEQLAPRSHQRKFELVKGDASDTVPAYLERNPETVIALAYFDMDLYEPTKVCLEAIKDHLTRGSVVGFDEVALAEFPGETVALREAWGLSNCRLRRGPLSHYQGYFVVE